MNSNNKIYELKNNNGLSIKFYSLGGRINNILIPDNKEYNDISAGYDNFADLQKNDVFIGAICGRFANRISNGKFSIENTEYQLNINNKNNHLHGGNFGFHTKFWEVEPQIIENGFVKKFMLTYFSPDGEENYPGNLKIQTFYELTDNNEFIIEFHAKTDKPTPINLTSHPYFNLKGFGNGNILDHFLEINSLEYTPLNKSGVPSGEIKKIKNTVMDFSIPKQISDTNNADYKQIKLVGGIDHNWILNKKYKELSFAARLSHPQTKRFIEVYTTESGLQVYSAIHFSDEIGTKNGFSYQKFGGLALEPQNFPDAPNKKNFPNSILYPGEKYFHKIIYKFYW